MPRSVMQKEELNERGIVGNSNRLPILETPNINIVLAVFVKFLGPVGPDTEQVSRVITPEISLLLDCVTLEFRLRRKSTVMQTRLLWYIS